MNPSTRPNSLHAACGLLFLLVAHVAAFAASAAPDRWEADIARFEEADALRPPPKDAVLFIGSSSIRMWDTLAADFPDHAVINRGFGGSQLEDSIAFFDRIVAPYAPRKIFLYAGANDINAGKSPQQVFEDFRTFVRLVHAKLPRTEVAFIAIAGNPARWDQIERVRETNALVDAWAARTPRVEYVDVHSAMLGDDGEPKPDIFIADRLHMNAAGYAIWREVVARHMPRG
ncbi:SGNH/GDSL hydrolase family protein [Opitutales bacterium ASA1]|uniref:SGNH/GDSL hydrolase family protein n=1 Tax=Congregicoccus parvus TaxID=3081749 RepID=UPI002B3142A3|nr:SGNH/GDSL hydrolase family protein [Opitutales bacterium ASA1]